MCILPSFTVFSVDASNPMMDTRFLTLVTEVFDILCKVSGFAKILLCHPSVATLVIRDKTTVPF